MTFRTSSHLNLPLNGQRQNQELLSHPNESVAFMGNWFNWLYRLRDMAIGISIADGHVGWSRSRFWCSCLGRPLPWLPSLCFGYFQILLHSLLSPRCFALRTLSSNPLKWQDPTYATHGIHLLWSKSNVIPNPSVVSSFVVSWRDPIRLPAFCSALRVFYISVFSHFHHDLLRFVLPIFYRLLLTDVNLLRIA